MATTTADSAAPAAPAPATLIVTPTIDAENVPVAEYSNAEPTAMMPSVIAPMVAAALAPPYSHT
jgi:hypothetical protein